MIKEIKRQIYDSIAVKTKLLADEDTIRKIDRLALICSEAIGRGNKIFLAGNGGSAADAQHIAAELVGRYQVERKGWPAIALTTDTSILTAVANDYGYDQVFSRQLQALANRGDVFIGISTSGNSPNILAVCDVTLSKGVYCAGLTGDGYGRMNELCDICIAVPSIDTPRIQELHITIGHILCSLIEKNLMEGE